MAISILIVEDEPLITATIETALQKQGYKVIGDADSFKSAIQEIESHIPDLVLLDIQLEGERDGIILAAELDKRQIPYLFLTSQTDPATIDRIKEVNPAGFIAKPFTEAGLRSNIELAWHQLQENTPPPALILRANGRTHKIPQDDILYLKAYDNYCYVATKSELYLTPITLKKVGSQLDPKVFARTHRSYVVNLNHVTSIAQNSLFIGETEVPLSSRRRQEIVPQLNQQ